MDFSALRVMIVGEGISGKGAYAALERLGARCGYFSEGLFPSDLIVISPGVPPTHPVVSYAKHFGIPLIGELELGSLINTAPIYAVTGTNGKTTTVELLHDILNRSRKTALCGNVGVSFSLTAVKGGYDCVVVEASSFQLETVKEFKPHIAALLNISEDHLDRYKNMSDYAKAKLNIAKNMTADDLLILNADDIDTKFLRGFTHNARIAYISVKQRVCGAYMLDDKLYLYDRFVCDRDRLKLNGDHNVANALTAMLMAYEGGADLKDVLQSFASFEADRHRVEYVSSKGGKDFYNDSKGTNIAATLSAVRCMSGSVALIAGGSDKGLDYTQLFTGLGSNVCCVIAMGETAQKMAEAARKTNYKNIVIASGLGDAVSKAYAADCDTVLLSPAAASFDNFKNYAMRGDAFIAAVKGLSDEKA